MWSNPPRCEALWATAPCARHRAWRRPGRMALCHGTAGAEQNNRPSNAVPLVRRLPQLQERAWLAELRVGPVVLDVSAHHDDPAPRCRVNSEPARRVLPQGADSMTREGSG